jgi:branched-subunit amino acid transport protein
MLERTSRFVLEVLPYLLTAVIAAIVLPQFVYSQAHTTKAEFPPNVSGRVNVLERVGAEVNVTHPASWRSE